MHSRNVAFALLFLLLCSFIPATQEDSEYATKYFVIAGTSTDFHALDSTAKQLSRSTGVPYENHLVYDAARGMIVPDTSSDEIWAGSYYPRRTDEERISIEMLSYYATKQLSAADSAKMIIMAGMYGDRQAAGARLKQVKKFIPGAYLAKSKLFQGCMH
jgi:hypothetical protein